MMDQKKRTLKRLGIAGVATAMTTMGVPALAGAATVRVAPNATASSISAPGAPTGLKATDAGAGEVTLSWTAPSGTVSGYNIYEGPASGAESSTPANGNLLVTGTTDTVNVLNDGTFYFEVAAVNAAGVGPKSSEANAPAAAVKPGVPSGVTVSAAYGGAVVSWTAPSSGGSPTGYTINYGTSSSSLTSQVTAGASATSSIIPGLTNSTEYFFDVVATNAAGSSTASSVVNTTPSTSAVPLPPTGVTAQPDGSGQVKVSWADSASPSSGVSGYNIYEGTSSGGESSTALNGSVPLSNSTTSQTVAVPNGTTAYFIVKAVNSAGTSVASNEDSATAGVTAATPAPTAPTNLTATAESYGSSTSPLGAVKLTWSAPSSSGSSNIADYKVLYKASSATSFDHSPVSGTSTVITGLTDGTKYDFEVEAQNAAGKNATPPTFGPAATVNASPTDTSPAYVQPPTGVTVTDTGATSNTIKWSKPKGTAATPTSYTVSRNGTPVASTTATSFQDDGSANGAIFASDSAPVNGTTYSYKVTANASSSADAYGAGTSAAAGPVSIKTGDPTPGAPTSLTATSSAAKSVTLKWSPPADLGAGNDTYKVLWDGNSVSTTSTTKTVTVASSTASTTLEVEAEAHVTAGGVSFGGFGQPASVSAFANGGVTVKPDAPTGLTAAGTSSSTIQLRWNAPTNATVTHYEILEGTAAAGSNAPAVVATINKSTSYTATSLTSGTYYFQVEATNGKGTSGASASAVATTTTTVGAKAPGSPTGLKATVDGGLVDLSWTGPSSSGGSKLSKYEIFSSSSSTLSSSAKPIATTTGTGTSAVLDNIGTSKIDLFVKAVNSSGTTSGASAPVVVTPSSFSERASAPGTPQVQAEAGGKAFVLWTAPSTTGGTLTGYFVTAHLVNGKGKTIFVEGANTRSATVSGLMTGSYYFTVVAVNSIGGGTPSSPSNFVKVTSATSATKVYVTPPPARVGAGDVTIRVTVNQPTARVQLWDEAYGKNFFFSKAVMKTTPEKYGNGMAEFVVHIDATNRFYVMVNGVKSNIVTARVMK